MKILPFAILTIACVLAFYVIATALQQQVMDAIDTINQFSGPVNYAPQFQDI